ncbi:MAG TPA: hypothetical protein VGL39_27660 [Jatrophihabitantaceae bacterium]|jgi:hypothetical protein
MTAGLLDFIDTPAQGNVRIPGVPWCADNGCFSDAYPGDDAWFAWLARNAPDADTCRFAVAPDVVADAPGTLARSLPWLPWIRWLGYPAAFVAQNGLTPDGVPWDEFDVLFIGGLPECLPCGYIRPAREFKLKRCPHCDRRLAEWKLGAAARRLVREAKTRGKWVHMGRVNSRKRYRYAAAIGCDSADGTTLAQFPDATLPDVLSWVGQPALDEVTA